MIMFSNFPVSLSVVSALWLNEIRQGFIKPKKQTRLNGESCCDNTKTVHKSTEILQYCLFNIEVFSKVVC